MSTRSDERAIELLDLSMAYSGRKAIQKLSFSVNSGGLFALLGPNGSGKSTLLKILSTLLKPSSGQALVYGQSVETVPEKVRRHIGVVFQSPSLDKKLTVWENMRHQGHLYGLYGSQLKTRIHTLLSEFKLQDRARDRVETLSGGMARRVEIAKALIHVPRLLILDEPSTGLDPAARRDLAMQLDQIRSQNGVTILMSTHVLEDVEGCSHLAMLDHGFLVALGRPSDLLADIPGGIITLESTDPDQLAKQISERFGFKIQRVNTLIKLEQSDPHGTAQKLAMEFENLITSVTVGKPTLEDLFLRKTGHTLDSGTVPLAATKK